MAEPRGPVAGPTPPVDHPAGLCGLCRHCRVVESGRGSRFYLCRRSREDPAFPRYPPIPVVRCSGFERDGEDGAGDANVNREEE